MSNKTNKKISLKVNTSICVDLDDFINKVEEEIQELLDIDACYYGDLGELIADLLMDDYDFDANEYDDSDFDDLVNEVWKNMNQDLLKKFEESLEE